MIAGAERMGVKTGLSASPLLLASPVFLLISHRGVPTVREQKNPVFLNVSSFCWLVGLCSNWCLREADGSKIQPRGGLVSTALCRPKKCP